MRDMQGRTSGRVSVDFSIDECWVVFYYALWRACEELMTVSVVQIWSKQRNKN